MLERYTNFSDVSIAEESEREMLPLRDPGLLEGIRIPEL